MEEQLGMRPPVTETNPDIIRLAEVLESYSEMIRIKLNDRGANIGKLWGYIVDNHTILIWLEMLQKF